MANNARQSRYRLANQILDVAREARFEPGHHLREQQLGDLLGVSRTPIRSALTLLAERGAVEAIKNQGFFLKAPPEELHRLEVEIPSTADQDLYTRIVEDRLSGQLNETITQTEISRRYGVDRILLQRTIAHLVNDGLIARNSGRGWTFFLPLIPRWLCVTAMTSVRRSSRQGFCLKRSASMLRPSNDRVFSIFTLKRILISRP